MATNFGYDDEDDDLDCAVDADGFTTCEAKPVSSVTRSFSPGSVAVPPAMSSLMETK